MGRSGFVWLPLVSLMLLTSPMTAQQRLPSEGGRTISLGQPNPWSWTIGAAVGLRDGTSRVEGIGEGRLGVYREILSRSLGVGGLQLEGYNQAVNASYNAGVRLRWVSQLTGIAVGADYSLSRDQVRPIFTYVYPFRRGGLFGDGSTVRLDLMPRTDRAFTIGIEKPLFKRIPAGRTRPATDRVILPTTRAPTPLVAPPTTALGDIVAVARSSARYIERLTVPWLDHHGSGGAASDSDVVRQIEALHRLVSGDGVTHTLDGEARRFHDAMDHAFASAVAAASPATDTTGLGAFIGARARAVLLAEVVLPYDRSLGQAKAHDTTLGLDVLARGAFTRWFLVESHLPAATAQNVFWVFDALLDIVEWSRAASYNRKRSSRFVWLPLQFALRAEQYDTQAELDDLVAQAVGEPFTEGNSVSYLINEQFQSELNRTIRAARDYHVLWTHDFRGFDNQGDPDEMSFRHVLRSYLAALTASVRAYDTTGTFPTYIILLDQWFYEVNRGRLFMDLLEDPTRHEVHLPSDFAWMEDSLRAAQDTLRAAISASVLLGQQRRLYGEAWLRNLVKVHVNITNAADPSFWSWTVVSNFPLPDAWMRDHRKIAFYDVTETDPFRGEAMLTGAGVGEHYANRSWEDRSLLVRGPVLRSLKAAARDALMKQGIGANDVPAALQPHDIPRNYWERIDAEVRAQAQRGVRTLSAVSLQNGTGFDAKQINVAKAVLYTLMPAGSVIKVPDSIWNSTFWGSALVGAALRGVRVLVMAPSLANAPARAFGSMARSRELVWRLVMASRMLSREISDAGGLLKVGMFTSTLPITDVAGRLDAINRALAQYEWLRDLYQFPPTVYPGLAELAATLREGNDLPGGGAQQLPEHDFESRERALLHMKVNFFASREAWRMMSSPEWVEITRTFVAQRVHQMQRHSTSLLAVADAADTTFDIGDEFVRRWYDALSPDERARVVFYTALGSANQNERSMVSDGEDALLISGWPPTIPYLDLLALVGQCQWIEGPMELDALLPRQGRIPTQLAHWFKNVF